MSKLADLAVKAAITVIEKLEKENAALTIKINFLMAENADLVAEIDKMKHGQLTYCAFCGEAYPCDEGAEQVVAHVLSCPDHPLAEMKDRAEKAEALLSDTIKALHNAKAENATLDQKLQDAQAAFIADEKAIKASLKLQAELEQENDAMRAKVEFYESR